MLRKSGLLRCLKLKASLTLGSRTFKIPLTRGLGLANLYIKQNWLVKLIDALYLDEKDTFIDVGVNLGQTLLQFRSVNAKTNYVGFEPNHTCCLYVEELIRLNGLEKSKIEQLALSDRRASVDFEFDSESDPRASINVQLRPGYFSKRVKVQAVVFDEDFSKLKASLIKIDVEGAELAVLTGMRKQLEEHRPLLVCEVLDSHGPAQLDYTQKQADELAALLHSRDYRIIRLMQDSSCEQLLSFQLIERFEIHTWEPASMQSNDYIFCHVAELSRLTQILQNITHG